MEVQIKLLNAKELAAAFRKAPELATREFAKVIEHTAEKIRNDAVRNTPVNSGILRQSITAQTHTASAVVEARAKYAGFVDQGTRPHIINVVNKKGLANQRTGQFFGRRVHHPGTRKQPFFTDAVKGNESFFNTSLTKALQTVLNSIH